MPGSDRIRVFLNLSFPPEIDLQFPTRDLANLYRRSVRNQSKIIQSKDRCVTLKTTSVQRVESSRAVEGFVLHFPDATTAYHWQDSICQVVTDLPTQVYIKQYWDKGDLEIHLLAVLTVKEKGVHGYPKERHQIDAPPDLDDPYAITSERPELSDRAHHSSQELTKGGAPPDLEDPYAISPGSLKQGDHVHHSSQGRSKSGAPPHLDDPYAIPTGRLKLIDHGYLSSQGRTKGGAPPGLKDPYAIPIIPPFRPKTSSPIGWNLLKTRRKGA
ncbi:MAG: hypothetical protein Q9227_000909 [Pyrenula ochraceoflavens]